MTIVTKTVGWYQYTITVAKQAIRWSAVLGLLALVGYLGYLNIQLKADQRVKESETKVEVLAGEVEVLQATILGLKTEGTHLQNTPQ